MCSVVLSPNQIVSTGAVYQMLAGPISSPPPATRSHLSYIADQAFVVASQLHAVAVGARVSVGAQGHCALGQAQQEVSQVHPSLLMRTLENM